jgi:cholesterol oxidase
MPDQRDVIVIGSGFGGAVTACRLSEAGYSVLVLERGRRWDKSTFPRKPGDAWLWDQTHPELAHGWIDFRVFPHMAVVQGAAVGGGSHIYANISVDAKPDTFEVGWPPEITYAVLAPHYHVVKGMMATRPVPESQWPERTRLLKLAAERTGAGTRFEALDLAVSFSDTWRPDLPDAYSAAHSVPFVNAHGKSQGTCVHLGNCDIGCDVGARNTLDLNYLARAESRGAEVRPLHLVRTIEPGGSGYLVRFDQLLDGRLVPGQASARIVVVAAGSLGSTELLLRCRDKDRTLPGLSAFLGRNWSSNGDFLTPAIHPLRAVEPTRGPTITAAVNFLDGARGGKRFFIEDGGFPDLVRDWLTSVAEGRSQQPVVRELINTLRFALAGADATKHVMPWFAQGRDAANGLLSLRAGRLFLDWDINESEKTMDAIITTHKEFAEATGGLPLVPPTWTVTRYLVTPHPLGGCNMGRSPQDGVVNHAGEVFGHRNLYVIDGAIVPKAIGLNPSKTIAALAERCAAIIVEQRR